MFLGWDIPIDMNSHTLANHAFLSTGLLRHSLEALSTYVSEHSFGQHGVMLVSSCTTQHHVSLSILVSFEETAQPREHPVLGVFVLSGASPRENFPSVSSPLGQGPRLGCVVSDTAPKVAYPTISGLDSRPMTRPRERGRGAVVLGPTGAGPFADGGRARHTAG